MSIAGKCSIVYQQGLSNKAVTVLYRYALQVIPADRRQCKTLHLLQIRKKIIEALHERDTEVFEHAVCSTWSNRQASTKHAVLCRNQFWHS